MFPAIVILMKWGDKYVPDVDGPAVVLEHSACGQVGDAYVACRCCGEEITAHNVKAYSGSEA